MKLQRTLISLAIATVVAIAGCSTERPMDTGKAEAAIKSKLQSGLRARLADDSITVRRVKCKIAHDRDTHCVAHVVSASTTVDLAIAGVYNAKSGTLRWHATGEAPTSTP
jgi:hypothetical protein